jgi:hypothetical protein
VIIRSWVALIKIWSENEIAFSSEAIRQTKARFSRNSYLPGIKKVT